MRATIRAVSICGSVRRRSFNRALLHAAGEIAPAPLRITYFPIDDLPFFWPDGPSNPESVIRLKDAIATADALLIATPEYNCGIPGILKNAIDWASQPFTDSPLAGKPAAIMGCTTSFGGTVRAQMQLRQTLQYVGVHALVQPELFVSHAQTRFDQAGRLVDVPTRGALARLLDALIDWTIRLRGAGIAPVLARHPTEARLRRVAPLRG